MTEMKKSQNSSTLSVSPLIIPSILVLMQCFRNKFPEIRQKEAFSYLFKKFLDNLHSWVHVAKFYSILHFAFNDITVMRVIAAEVLERENLIYFYTKRPESHDYSNSFCVFRLIIDFYRIVENRHAELSQVYANYVKKLAGLINSCRILEIDAKKVPDFIKSTSKEDIIWIYSQLYELVKMAVGTFFGNSLFCCKYRIYKNILRLIYKDVARFYVICHACVTELLDQFTNMSLTNAKTVHQINMSFVKMTEELQNSLGGMFSQLKESPSCMIAYYKVFRYYAELAHSL